MVVPEHVLQSPLLHLRKRKQRQRMKQRKRRRKRRRVAIVAVFWLRPMLWTAQKPEKKLTRWVQPASMMVAVVFLLAPFSLHVAVFETV